VARKGVEMKDTLTVVDFGIAIVRDVCLSMPFMAPPTPPPLEVHLVFRLRQVLRFYLSLLACKS